MSQTLPRECSRASKMILFGLKNGEKFINTIKLVVCILICCKDNRQLEVVKMEVVVKGAMKTTKTGKVVSVVEVFHGKKFPTTLWHMQMEALVDARKAGKDINAIVDAYDEHVKKTRTEIIVPKPVVKSLFD